MATKSETEHAEQHKKLHKMLDVLLADFINDTGKLPSDTTIIELMEWSHLQTQTPKGYAYNIHDMKNKKTTLFVTPKPLPTLHHNDDDIGKDIVFKKTNENKLQLTTVQINKKGEEI